jgi:cation diffusion facilitator CzcD-associated flavoprotein CzcO
MQRRNRVITPMRNYLPPKVSYPIARAAALAVEKVFWVAARGAPNLVKKVVRTQNISKLPSGYPVDVDFKPSYNPWDERLCLVADGDLFTEISRGALEVVTDHIAHFDASGIVLKSGRRLDADIIVTATGLNLLALGGVRISIDGAELKPQDRFSYKAHMLEDVPNLFWCIGYTHASWTLRADMTARAAARLIDYMKTHGYTHAYPHPSAGRMPEKPTWDLQAGYVMRNPHALPKSAKKRPWVVRQDYFADAFDHRFLDKVDEEMVFGRVRTPAQLVG